MITPLSAPMARVADDQAIAAESAVRELREILGAASGAGSDGIVRYAARALIDEAIGHLAAARLMLA